MIFDAQKWGESGSAAEMTGQDNSENHWMYIYSKRSPLPWGCSAANVCLLLLLECVALCLVVILLLANLTTTSSAVVGCCSDASVLVEHGPTKVSNGMAGEELLMNKEHNN